MTTRCWPWKRFLCLFAQEHTDFRLQELQSLAAIAGCQVVYNEAEYSHKSPFLMIDLPSAEHGEQIMKRSLLIKSLYEVWGYGSDYQQLRVCIETLPSSVMEPFLGSDYSFKLFVKGYNKRLSLAHQKQAIEKLEEFIHFNGSVDLSNAQHEFYLLEDYGDNPNAAPSTPTRLFFGRLVSNGQRHLIDHYAVKTRKFIGNTSMDAQLSLIMANQAKVAEGSLVMDPFAGTGSLLVGSAHYGGYVLGTDINWILVHGRGKSSRSTEQHKWRGQDENVYANLLQYGLEKCYIDMLVSDSACSVWRNKELFDAIITDRQEGTGSSLVLAFSKTPYGVREGGRKVGSSRPVPNPVPDDQKEGHISAVHSYNMSDIYSDLLDLAARYLVVGGRLVYWIPIIRGEYSHELIPSHTSLKFISSSEQPLSKMFSRRLITMEKIKTCTHEVTTGYQDNSLFDNFRDKYFSKIFK